MSRRQRGSPCTAAPYLKRGCCTQASSVTERLGALDLHFGGPELKSRHDR